MTIPLDTLKARERHFPDYSKPIFLDTNVVQYLSSFGEFIYDSYLSPEREEKLSRLGSKIADDVHALGDLMDWGRRGGLPIVISSRTWDELAATRNRSKRARLLPWCSELAQYSAGWLEAMADGLDDGRPNQTEVLTPTQRHTMTQLFTMLPDQSDRHLVIDALSLRCGVFLTMDYKTIWSKREGIAKFGIRILRPVELTDELRHWARLQ